MSGKRRPPEALEHTNSEQEARNAAKKADRPRFRRKRSECDASGKCARPREPRRPPPLLYIYIYIYIYAHAYMHACMSPPPKDVAYAEAPRGA